MVPKKNIEKHNVKNHFISFYWHQGNLPRVLNKPNEILPSVLCA
jgi:hypothetical protein